jgi:hypothetical protein
MAQSSWSRVWTPRTRKSNAWQNGQFNLNFGASRAENLSWRLANGFANRHDEAVVGSRE